MKAKLATILLLAAGSVNAASLEPKRGVNLLYIDGVEVKDKRELSQIEPGKAQVVLNYNKKLKDSGKERVFDSSPFVVTFDAPDKEITIAPPKFYTYDQAQQAFKHGPKWQIETDDGQKIAFEQEVLDRAEGFMPYFDMPERVAKHNQARGISFGTSAAIMAKAQSVVKVAETGEEMVVQGPTTNLEQLQAWYQKASKQERKEFRKWMIDQE